MEKMNRIIAVALLFSSKVVVADTYAEDVAIKDIYFHDRLTNPYIGVIVSHSFNNNTECGAGVVDRFVVRPDKISDRMFAMLLSMKAAAQTGTLGSVQADTSCIGAYPTLNYVEIK